MAAYDAGAFGRTTPEQHAKDLERIRNFRLMDDDFMVRVFEDNLECTELVLHIVLNRPDLQVKEVRTQHTVKNLTGHSVRLDIYAVDPAGKQYNIEIQRSDAGAACKRARYNSSLLDANALQAGEPYTALPESYVIFITENDVLGYGKPLYTIDRTIREADHAAFPDESHIVYVNASYQDDSPLGLLMKDFFCTDPNAMHYPVLAQHTRYFKEESEGVTKMCKIMEDVRNEGIAQGTLRSHLDAIRSLMAKLQLTAEQAMDILSIPTVERSALLQAL